MEAPYKPEIPTSLRHYQLDGPTLARLILSLELVNTHLKGYGPDHLNQSEIQTLDDLCEILRLIERRKSPPQREYKFTTLSQEGEYKLQPLRRRSSSELDEDEI